MTDRSTELKPCPFCGGEVEFRKPYVIGEGGYIAHLLPAPCASFEIGALSEAGQDELIAAWNTRKREKHD